MVDEDRVYTLGTMGDLRCLDAKTGKPVWTKSFPKDYGATPPVWGFSAHLLVEKDLVIALVGGEKKGVVAFDKKTGKERWTALTFGGRRLFAPGDRRGRGRPATDRLAVGRPGRA